MGTRGFIGLVVGDEEKIMYNHFDSYPEGLGMEVCTWLRSILDVPHGLETMRAYAGQLRMVDSDVPPTPEQIEALKNWADLNVSNQSYDDWYCLLRRTQGDLGATLAAGYAVDASEFPTDSLFAEWGYLVDLDTETFEVFRGFQKEAHNLGRFAHRAPKESNIGPAYQYYPVALRAAWSFNALPTGEEFLATLTEMDED